MSSVRRTLSTLSIIISFGLIPALIGQLFVREPSRKNIHIRNFRYGKDPSVIRVNRGDTLHITFSTEDTGHSFFLEEFDIDAKVSPSRNEVEIFKPSDPSSAPLTSRELTFVARHKGIFNFLTAKSNYRCHIWCGPMHAFEQGKLIILPNTLLIFSLGCIAGILFLWILRFYRNHEPETSDKNGKDLFNSGFFRKIVVSRWPQMILTILALVMIYIVIMTSVFGTKVSGRNLGVLLMWAVWLFLLVTILTPLGGRIWCTICPLPFLGDWLQRRSFFSPIMGRTGNYNNLFSGLFLKWPDKLRNSWLKLIVFLILATFSTTLVASPRVSGITVIMLLLVPTLLALVFELRAFCRYVCPVSVFVAPFSELSLLAVRNKSQETCNQCRAVFCQNGSAKGWGCPYGLNVRELKQNSECGLCLECTRSCTYNNVSMFYRPFGNTRSLKDLSEAWLTIAIFTTALIYSVLYLGHWPEIRDYVNILDKKNLDLFGVYALFFWIIVLIIMPGLLYLLSLVGSRLSKVNISIKDIFLTYTGSLLPLGLMIWIAFVIPMFFVNITFIIQSLSDPFGWGWDFFGTAGIPWHQFLPGFIPWFQAIVVLAGLHLSLKNTVKTWKKKEIYDRNQIFFSILPVSILLVTVSILMILFFTN
jgi:polyferredoxin